MIENSSESKLREQFNSQRARMKEMFILKETEVKELKNKMVFLKREVDEKSSQLVIAEYNREKDLEDQKLRYQQEIQTLQQLISETCDESALANSELKRLNDEKERQKQEIVDLKEMFTQQQVKQSFKYNNIICFSNTNSSSVVGFQ